MSERKRRGMRGDVQKGKKGENRSVSVEFEDDDEGRPKTRSASASARYPPDGSQYRLSWNEYFLHLPKSVTYRQYDGWQRVLDCIPSAQRVPIKGTHVATDPRLSPGTVLRNIPSLPDWIPTTPPIIVLQAFVYSNTRATWIDLTKRMGYTWDKSDIKQMYRFSNKHTTAAGRWKNVIGVPSREPKLKPGRKSAAYSSINYASIVWDDYILLPPHCPPQPQLPQIPNSDQANTGADTVATGETAAATAAVAPRRTRRKPRNPVRAGPKEAVSARPYYGPSSRSAAPSPSSDIVPNQEQESAAPASPRYPETPAQPVHEMAIRDPALQARYEVLCNQELIARMLALTAARERKAIRARINGKGVLLNPDQEKLDRLLEQADTTTLLPSPLEQAARTLRSSNCAPLTTVPQPPTSSQQISPPLPPQSAALPSFPLSPELPLFRPPALFSQTQEQDDQLLHDLLEQETGSPLNLRFPPNSDPDEGDHYLQMLQPSENTQGGIEGKWLELPPFDILEDAALPFVGWDSQEQFGESGLDHGLGAAQVDPQPISAGSVDVESMYDVIRHYLEDKNEIGQVTGPPSPDEAS